VRVSKYDMYVICTLIAQVGSVGEVAEHGGEDRGAQSPHVASVNCARPVAYEDLASASHALSIWICAAIHSFGYGQFKLHSW